MRIAIVCNDTRGGIQPYVALALGLRAAGHDVRAIAPADLAPMFSARGLETAPLSGSIEEIMRGSGGVTEKGMLASIRFAAREMPRRLGQWTREALDACQGVELITGGIGGMVVALSVDREGGGAVRGSAPAARRRPEPRLSRCAHARHPGVARKRRSQAESCAHAGAALGTVPRRHGPGTP